MKALILAFACCSLAACDKPAETPPPPSEHPTSAPSDHDHAAHEHEVLPAGDIVPGASLYQLEVEFVGHDARPRTWDDFRGSEVIVSMIYTTCTTACPLIVSEIKQILKSADREHLPVLLVSMDPTRDTPEALTAMKERHGLGLNWTFAQTSDNEVREVAAALGARYRQLPNGDFNHSQVITLLDSTGSIVERAEGLGPQRETLVQKLNTP